MHAHADYSYPPPSPLYSHPLPHHPHHGPHPHESTYAHPPPSPPPTYAPPPPAPTYAPPPPAPTYAPPPAPTYAPPPPPSYHAHPPTYKQKGHPYAFSYGVKDYHTGNDFGHHASSDGDTVTGEYRVLLPDGRTQVVTYTADHYTGYRAEEIKVYEEISSHFTDTFLFPCFIYITFNRLQWKFLSSRGCFRDS
ncbi:cuticle protein 19-like [Scylla paramamosain]|uniref:cuticle protein 19-like n=1 Tax=Scylla paramamosain TaxID=85552 RepID=UPI003082CCF3